MIGQMRVLKKQASKRGMGSSIFGFGDWECWSTSYNWNLHGVQEFSITSMNYDYNWNQQFQRKSKELSIWVGGSNAEY